MKVVKLQETGTFTIKGRSVSGLSFPFYLIHTTNNTAFDDDLVTQKAINLRAVLRQNGVETVLFSDNLRNLVFISSFGKDAFRQFDGTQLAYSKIQLAHGASNKAITLFPQFIDFFGIINLQGDDEIEVSYSFNGTEFDDKVDASASYAMIDALDAVGVQEYIPQIKSSYLRPDESEHQFNIGNFVPYILFANYDLKSYLAADGVVSQLTLNSDKFKRSDNRYEIMTKQRMGDYLSSDVDPFNSFSIYAGKPLMNAQVNLQTTAANVNADSNYLIWVHATTSKELLQRAEGFQRKHSQRDWSHIKAVN